MSDITDDEAAARDPQTPSARLQALVHTQLHAVLANPALDLLCMETPDWWGGVRASMRRRIAKHRRCPPSFVSWALRARDALKEADWRHLATNRALPANLRRAAFFRCSGSSGWEKLRASADCFTLAEREALERAGVHVQVMQRVTAPRQEDYPVLLSLGPLGRWLAVSQAGCPGPLLDGLFDAEWPEPGWDVLRHPHLAPERLERALTSTRAHVRQRALANPLMTQAQLQRASLDRTLHRSLAQRPGLPEACFPPILASADKEAGLLALANPALPEALQMEVALGTNDAARRRLWTNPQLTAAARAALAKGVH